MTFRSVWLTVVGFFNQVAMVEVCSSCGGPLSAVTHEEESADERAGNARSRSRYACVGCRHLYSRIYRERFDGDVEEWWRCADDRWESLERAAWPKLERTSGFRRLLWRARAITRRS